MPDDMEIRVPQSDEHIDITDLKEVDYWTKWFGVSETRLRLALLKLKLREVNGSLWVTQLREPGKPIPGFGLPLAEHLLTDAAMEVVARS